jgi:hypothetical protein
MTGGNQANILNLNSRFLTDITSPLDETIFKYLRI